MSSTDLLERTDISDTDDSEDFAHYAESAKVTEGYIMGTPVIALCGIEFIPHRDPLKLKVCPICKQIVDALYLNHD
jgi:hypothetical protein